MAQSESAPHCFYRHSWLESKATALEYLNFIALSFFQAYLSMEYWCYTLGILPEGVLNCI